MRGQLLVVSGPGPVGRCHQRSSSLPPRICAFGAENELGVAKRKLRTRGSIEGSGLHSSVRHCRSWPKGLFRTATHRRGATPLDTTRNTSTPHGPTRRQVPHAVSPRYARGASTRRPAGLLPVRSGGLGQHHVGVRRVSTRFQAALDVSRCRSRMGRMLPVLDKTAGERPGRVHRWMTPAYRPARRFRRRSVPYSCADLHCQSSD